MSVTGLEEMTPSQPSVGFCPLPLGEGLGVRAVTVAFRLQSASEEALIIGQEAKPIAFFRLSVWLNCCLKTIKMI